MEYLNIPLTFNSDRVREMYYHSGSGNIFTYKPTQKAMLYCLVTVLLTLCIYFASFKNPGISWLIVVGAIIFLLTGLYAISEVVTHIKWTRDVEAFVRENAKYQSHQLKLTSSALELIQDGTITIERWENIKSVKLDDIHVIILTSGGPSFIFPSSSMTPEEFAKPKDFIINKITIAVEA